MSSVRLTPQRTTPTPTAKVAAGANPNILKQPRVVDGFERRRTAPSLQRGATGPAVSALQNKLLAARAMSLTDVRSGPGVYGPRTEAAVRRFQESRGLSPTGVAGPSTMAALNGNVRFEVQVISEPERTVPISKSLFGESSSDEVTQPIAIPI